MIKINLDLENIFKNTFQNLFYYQTIPPVENKTPPPKITWSNKISLSKNQINKINNFILENNLEEISIITQNTGLGITVHIIKNNLSLDITEYEKW